MKEAKQLVVFIDRIADVQSKICLDECMRDDGYMMIINFNDDQIMKFQIFTWCMQHRRILKCLSMSGLFITSGSSLSGHSYT